MLRFLLLCLAASFVSRGFAAGAGEQTLPAINVQYEFPASETLLSKHQVLGAAVHDKAFQDRIRRLQKHTDVMGEVANRFVKQAVVDLDRLLEVLQASST